MEDVEYFFKVVLEWEDVEYFFKVVLECGRRRVFFEILFGSVLVYPV